MMILSRSALHHRGKDLQKQPAAEMDLGQSFLRPDAAEEENEVHQIHGTDISFSSKPDVLDEKAVEVLRELKQKGTHGLKLSDALGMDPHNLPKKLLPLAKGFSLSHGESYWTHLKDTFVDKKDCKWKAHSSVHGYGIRLDASGYQCLKRTFVYHEGNHKTNWFMVFYVLIHEGSNIKTDDVLLCHVFQSDNYDSRPNLFPKSAPNISEVDSLILHLEGLMNNPESFKDFYELDEMHNKCQANKPNGKRAGVWEHFTPIEVRGREGQVMFTLAICHGCNVVYLTGKRDKNYGTQTLNKHLRKCRDQHHIAGDPQGADHEIP